MTTPLSPRQFSQYSNQAMGKMTCGSLPGTNTNFLFTKSTDWLWGPHNASYAIGIGGSDSTGAQS